MSYLPFEYKGQLDTSQPGTPNYANATKVFDPNDPQVAQPLDKKHIGPKDRIVFHHVTTLQTGRDEIDPSKSVQAAYTDIDSMT